MKQDSQVSMAFNYTVTRASEWDIAEAVVKHNDSKLWTPREALESLRAGGDAVKIWMEILKAGLPSFARQETYHNIVPSILRNQLATLISGTTVIPTFKANYMALGSGSSTPANSDTQLQTETLRGLFTNRYAIDNVAYLDKFFSTTEVAGNTYNEAGIFVDGSAGANTGYLLSRVLINETLAVNETLTVNASITII